MKDKDIYRSDNELLAELLKELREIKKKMPDRDNFIVSEIGVIDNSELTRAMNISGKTAATWRNTNVLRYTKIGAKFFYLISDIKEMLRERFGRH